MFRKGYFDICLVRQICELNGTIPNGEAMRLLHPLHCVNFEDMPKELLRGLPVLIQQAIGTETLEMEVKALSTYLKVAA